MTSPDRDPAPLGRMTEAARAASGARPVTFFRSGRGQEVGRDLTDADAAHIAACNPTDALKVFEACRVLRFAAAEIVATDPVDNALDPQRPARLAANALAAADALVTLDPTGEER